MFPFFDKEAHDDDDGWSEKTSFSFAEESLQQLVERLK